MSRKYFIAVLLLVFWGVCQGQTKRIDSLKKQIHLLTDKGAKLDALFSLCKEQSSLNADTLYRYAARAKALALSQHDTLKTALADYYIALHFLTQQYTDSSLAAADRYLKQGHSTAEKEVYIDFSILKARLLRDKNRPKDGLELLYPILTAAENQKDTITQVKVTNEMVGAYVALHNDKEAQKWCYKVLQLYPQHAPFVYQEPYGISLSNMGLTYLHLYENGGPKTLLDSGAYYTDKAIRVNRENESLGRLAYSLGLKATIFGLNHKPEQGEQLLKESLAIYRQVGNVFYIINTMAVMGNFYGITNQPQKGIAICKEGIELGKTFAPNIFLYQNLAGNYKLAGKYREYGETLEQWQAIEDALHEKNTAESLAEMETKYETQKKEATILQQKYELSKRNYLLYGTIVLALLSLVVARIIFVQYHKKQQLKMQLLRAEEQHLLTQAIAAAKENERKRIAADLHDNIGAQLSYIRNNINFVLDAPQKMSDADEKHFLNMVNDTAKTAIIDLRETIWALNKDTVTFLEFADKLKMYLKHHLDNQQVVQLQINETITGNWQLPSSEAIHIFRIMQEAAGNSVKHAAASMLQLSIVATEHSYTLRLADNGKGFDKDATYRNHYGLENMQKRAAEIGATLQIESKWNEGTIIVLEKEIEENEPPA